MMKTFYNDLQRGKYYEKKAISILKTHGFDDLKHIEGYNPYFDIEGKEKKGKKEKKVYFEVKYDAYSANTKKFFVEISKQNGRPSGLTITKSKYYILFSYYEYWIIPTEKLKESIKSYLIDKLREEGNNKNELYEGDITNAIYTFSTCTNNSRGVIIPLSYILNHSIYSGFHNEKKEIKKEIKKEKKEIKESKQKSKTKNKIFNKIV